MRGIYYFIIGIFLCVFLGMYGIYITFERIGGIARITSPDFFANMVSVTTNVVRATQSIRQEENNSQILESATKDEYTEIVVSEIDANKLLQKAVETHLQALVENATVTLHNDFAEVRVRMKYPMRTTLIAQGSVVVRDGKLYPNIIKVKYGFLQIPVRFVRSLLNKALRQKESNEWLETPNLVWKTFVFEEEKIIFKLKKIE